MVASLGKFAYVSRDKEFKRELARWIGRRLLEPSEKGTVAERLRRFFAGDPAERYARAHGADSIEVTARLEAGIPSILGTASESSLAWELHRTMENRSEEETAKLGRDILGKAESLPELAFQLQKQRGNPHSVPSTSLVFVGDFRYVKGVLDLATDRLVLAHGATRIELEFGTDGPNTDGPNPENVHAVQGRAAEVLGELAATNPIRIRCFAIWV